LADRPWHMARDQRKTVHAEVTIGLALDLMGPDYEVFRQRYSPDSMPALRLGV
jgi:hypothetical protein